MKQLTIYNLPDSLIEALKGRATEDHRSASQETVVLLSMLLDPEKFDELKSYLSMLEAKYKKEQDKKEPTAQRVWHKYQ